MILRLGAGCRCGVLADCPRVTAQVFPGPFGRTLRCSVPYHLESMSACTRSPSPPMSPKAPTSAALARDIARALGSGRSCHDAAADEGGAVQSLSRDRAGHDWPKLGLGRAALEHHLLPLRAGLDDIPALSPHPRSGRIAPTGARSGRDRRRRRSSRWQRWTMFRSRWSRFKDHQVRVERVASICDSMSKEDANDDYRRAQGCELIKEHGRVEGDTGSPEGAGRDPDRAHPQPDRAFQGSCQGQSFAPRAADDGQQAAHACSTISAKPRGSGISTLSRSSGFVSNFKGGLQGSPLSHPPRSQSGGAGPGATTRSTPTLAG